MPNRGKAILSPHRASGAGFIHETLDQHDLSKEIHAFCDRWLRASAESERALADIISLYEMTNRELKSQLQAGDEIAHLDNIEEIADDLSKRLRHIPERSVQRAHERPGKSGPLLGIEFEKALQRIQIDLLTIRSGIARAKMAAQADAANLRKKKGAVKKAHPSARLQLEKACKEFLRLNGRKGLTDAQAMADDLIRVLSRNK